MDAPVISGRRSPVPPPPPPAGDGEEGFEESEEPTPPVPAEPADEPGVLTHWATQARGDQQARTARADGRRWPMPWMREQPTSVHDHVRHFLHESRRRADGRRGWGLRTASPLVNGVHAGLYTAYGMSVGLLVTLAAYALAWMAQRPGRAFLLVAAAIVIRINLGGQ